MVPEPYDEDRIDRLGDTGGFRYCSAEELRTFLNPAPDWRVADFGSGTGLFTRELAPVVGTVFAVDARHELHGRWDSMPGNVVPLTADFGRLPLPTNALDGGVSTRTYHHGQAPSVDEFARVIRPGGRFVVVDWSATGAGDREFRVDEDYADIATVQSDLLDSGFRIVRASDRRETFVVVGQRR